jgi:POT family proton-dependent oligopeptide transporter
MCLAFVTLFISNNVIGWIGRFYEQMSPEAFWGLHAAIGATGGILVLLFGRPLGRALESDSSSR